LPKPKQLAGRYWKARFEVLPAASPRQPNRFLDLVIWFHSIYIECHRFSYTEQSFFPWDVFFPIAKEQPEKIACAAAANPPATPPPSPSLASLRRLPPFQAGSHLPRPTSAAPALSDRPGLATADLAGRTRDPDRILPDPAQWKPLPTWPEGRGRAPLPTWPENLSSNMVTSSA
jgi:hypothetical protein